MKWPTRLTVNQILALVAFVLGAAAIFAHPTRSARLSIDSRELAVIVQRGADRIAPLQLADWIIQGRADYRLLDLRDADVYGVYHIPTAENAPLATLPDADLARNEKIVLYAADEARSAQAWFLLRARGFKGVYMLGGGFEGWKQDVLFPVMGQGADAVQVARKRAVANHFGGDVLMASAGGATALAAAPPPAATTLPPPPPAVKAAVQKPKKKEGC